MTSDGRETARLLKEAATAGAAEREDLLEQVIVLNIGVAHAIAHRYRNRSIPVEDLEQVACMALVRAAQKFDVSPGPRLPDLRRADHLR